MGNFLQAKFSWRPTPHKATGIGMYTDMAVYYGYGCLLRIWLFTFYHENKGLLRVLDLRMLQAPNCVVGEGMEAQYKHLSCCQPPGAHRESNCGQLVTLYNAT